MAFFTKIVAWIQMILISVGIGMSGYNNISYTTNEHKDIVVENPVAIVDNKKSDYKIVLGEAASTSETTAANDLQDYIKQISGVTLEMISDNTERTTKEIIVGKTNRPEDSLINRTELGDEGFLIAVQNDNLIVAGGQKRGTMYGVYTLLETYFGCRWFTPTLTQIPKNDTLVVDKNTYDKQIPTFEYRSALWNVVYDNPWSAHQKINSSLAFSISDTYGSDIKYAGFAHTMQNLVPESCFNEHPEYFSYRTDLNARTTDQRCLSNPDVLNITIQNCRNLLLANPNADILSITQNDNDRYCQCDNCNAIAAQYGGQSGLNIWFVNQVAEALGDEFPNVEFDTFAYTYTQKAPTNIKVADNVVVRLCSINCCFSHPVYECGHTRGEAISEYCDQKDSTFADDLHNWSQISKKLYIWDYTTNFRNCILPYPNIHVLSDNMQYYADNGVKGVMAQGNNDGGTTSGEFAELKAYLLAKLLWDPNCDVEYHMTEFLNAFYGEESAKYIREYINYIEYKSEKAYHIYCFNWPYQNGFYGSFERRKLDKLWNEAEKAAKTDEQLERVQRSRLSWRYYKSCMYLDEFGPITRISENKKFYNDLVRLGVTQLKEGSTLVDNPDYFAGPTSWSVKR